MKVVLFLSRFTLLCNIAFILFVVLRWLEKRKSVSAGDGKLIPLPLVQDVIISLGVAAIVINLVMNMFYVGILLLGRIRALPSWLVVTNFIFLLVEIYYFFLYK